MIAKNHSVYNNWPRTFTFVASTYFVHILNYLFLIIIYIHFHIIDKLRRTTIVMTEDRILPRAIWRNTNSQPLCRYLSEWGNSKRNYHFWQEHQRRKLKLNGNLVMIYPANVHDIVSDDNSCRDRNPQGSCCTFATPIMPENCNGCVIMLGTRKINSLYSLWHKVFLKLNIF